jgi:hypothetical protein
MVSAEPCTSERWFLSGWKVWAQAFESRGSKSVAPRGDFGAGVESAMDVACVVGVKVRVVTMENNNRAVEHIVGACCRGGEIPVEDAAFRAASDEDRVMVIGRHTNAGKASTRRQVLVIGEKDGTYGGLPL